MAFGPSHQLTEASIVPNLLTQEDDGSITRANDTGITFGQAALIQANGVIGDGPYGGSSGDFDAYKLQVSAGWVLAVSVDGFTIDAALEVYNSAGTLVASNSNRNAFSFNPFVQFTAAASDTYTVVVHAQRTGSQQLSDPFDSGSGPGAGSKGNYRIFINTTSSTDDPHIYLGTVSPDTINGGAGDDVIYGMGANLGTGGGDRLNGAEGNDLFVWSTGDNDGHKLEVINGGSGNDVVEINSFGNMSLRPDNVGGALFFVGPLGVNTDSSVRMSSIEAIDIRGGQGVSTYGAYLTIENLSNTGLTGTIRYFGNLGADNIDASQAANHIVFFGRSGNDTFMPGTNNVSDDLDGGAGTDTLTFDGIGPFGVRVDLHSNTAQNTGGAGSMTIRNFETLVGTRFSDILIGSSGDDTINGGTGDDSLSGGGTMGRWGNNGASDRIGDVNGDGRADIVQINADGTVHALTATGETINPGGTFDNPRQWATGSRPIDQIGDFNGDGRADLVQFYAANNNAYVWLSNGNGFDAYTQWGTGFSPTDTIADLDGDGRADVIQLHANGSAYAWLSTGIGFTGPTVWGTGVLPTDRLADVNGDGRLDLVQAHANGNAYVALSNGTSFSPYAVWGTSFLPADRPGDFNGDGKADMIEFAPNGHAYVWLSNGATFLPHNDWGTGFRATDQLADFNGDGKLDVIQLHENGKAFVWLSTGTSFAGPVVWATGVTPGDRVADFNGDGKSDVLQLAGNGNGNVWLSNGSAFEAYTVWANSGSGGDTFVFTGAFGHDIVTDFRPGAASGDLLRFDHGRFADFNAVMSSTTDDGAGNTVIRFDAQGHETITLMNVLRSQLTADDFVL